MSKLAINICDVIHLTLVTIRWLICDVIHLTLVTIRWLILCSAAS